MFITLTTLNAGTEEVVNVREIRRAWVERITTESIGYEVASTLMLVIEFVGAPTLVRYVPIDDNERPDPTLTDAVAALGYFHRVVLAAVR